MNLLKDDIRKLYFKYFFPTMCAALSTSIYILFDTIFIGQGVGGKGLTALNIVLPIYSIYFQKNYTFFLNNSFCCLHIYLVCAIILAYFFAFHL